jgi:hypothetical protein
MKSVIFIKLVIKKKPTEGCVIERSDKRRGI